MPKLFISYRRDDSDFSAHSLYQALNSKFGPQSVFIDVDAIPPGVDFRKHLDDCVSRCDILLAVVGSHWLDARHPSGKRRLDDPGDFVRIEIEVALKRDIPVIPVLVGGASMPSEDDLPDGLKKFSYRNAVEVRSGRDFDHGVGRLINDMEELLKSKPAASMKTSSQIDATSSSSTPSKQSQHPATTKPKRPEQRESQGAEPASVAEGRQQMFPDRQARPAKSKPPSRRARAFSPQMFRVAISADWQRIAGGSPDGPVYMWDVDNGVQLTAFHGHSEIVNAVTFSSDGRRIASGSNDRTVRLWYTDSGSESVAMRGHTGHVYDVAFSSDGRRIVSGSDDESVRVWDAEKGIELRVLQGHTSKVTSVGFSPDGQRIVSGSFDKTVRVWDVETGIEIRVLHGHEHGVTSVAYSPDGGRIVSGNTVHAWDAETGKQLCVFQNHDGSVTSVAVSPDSSRIAGGTNSGNVVIWDVESGQQLRVLTLAKGQQSAERDQAVPERVTDSSPGKPYVDDHVQFTAYCPRQIYPDRFETLLAFAHLDELPSDAEEDEPDPVEEVKRQAQHVLGEKVKDYRTPTQESAHPVPRAGELTFVLDLDGCRVNPPRQSFFWEESVHQVKFRIRAPMDLNGKTCRGKLSVFLGRILLADLNLSVAVTTSAGADGQKAKRPDPVKAKPYDRIFASYSRKDISVVKEFERYARAKGDRYLRDLVDLQAGEDWNDGLKKLIDEANVFQLFWSKNSMRSPFIRHEWEYALSLGRPFFIRPTYWEEPFPEEPPNLPPADLMRLHFQYSGRRSVVELEAEHKRSREELTALVVKLSDAYSAMDVQRGGKLHEQFTVYQPIYDALRPEDPLRQMADEALDWLDRVDWQQREEEGYGDAVDFLEKGLDDCVPLQELVRRNHAALRFDRDLPEVLKRRLAERLRTLGTADSRRNRLLIVPVVVAVVAVLVLTVALIVWLL